MKINLLVLASMMVIGGISISQTSFAKVQGCDSAASNVISNGGSCSLSTPPSAYPRSYSCTGASGLSFALVPSGGPTACAIVAN